MLDNGVRHLSFYSWEDKIYENFMIDVMKALEPRIEEKNVIIADQN
jgi:hypothetical protein